MDHELTRGKATARSFRAWAVGATFVLALLLVLPMATLLMTTSPFEIFMSLRSNVFWSGLGVSFVTTSVTALCVLLLGLPTSWLLTQSSARVARCLEVALQLPVVTPPAVAGVALLLTFGRNGLWGTLVPGGHSLAFTAGAVVVAQIFVAGPLFMQSAIESFRRLEPDMLTVARTLGASQARVFFAIAIPNAAPSLTCGLALCWARALGEFGATLMFAGSSFGRTRTLPLTIYAALESDVRMAHALASVLALVAIGLFFVVRGVRRGALYTVAP